MFAESGEWAGLANDPVTRRHFETAAFTTDKLTDAALSRASHAVSSLGLGGGGGGGDGGGGGGAGGEHGTISSAAFAANFEAVAAGLSQANAFKPAIKLDRHPYKGGRRVPDCVEVVVRELLDLLLFDPHCNELDLARLPPTTVPAVVQFYRQLAGGGFKGAHEQSAAWYGLCQELPTCEYISTTPAPASVPYELLPTMANVMRTVGVLLGAPGGAEWSRLSELIGYWNRLEGRGVSDLSLELIGEQSERMHRSVLSDEVTGYYYVRCRRRPATVPPPPPPPPPPPLPPHHPSLHYRRNHPLNHSRHHPITYYRHTHPLPLAPHHPSHLPPPHRPSHPLPPHRPSHPSPLPSAAAPFTQGYSARDRRAPNGRHVSPFHQD